MVFVRQAYAAIVPVTRTLVIQSAGIAALIQWVRAHLPRRTSRPGRIHSAVLMVRLTSLMVCLHMLEILLWASFYRWKCFSTWESAFYFSATSYSTVGSEGLILQQAWRQMGPIESLTGVLMCALSASFLFAVVTRLVERDGQSEVTKER
jgi:voltage-gated potassium channel